MTAQLVPAACLVCGDPEPVPALAGLLERCRDCGFTWTTDRAQGAAPAAGELYGDAYFGGDDETAGYEDYFQPAARRFEAARRLAWLQRRGPVDSLLEIGAAGGFFLEAATRAGIRARGYDVADRAVTYGRRELGVDVRLGPFEAAPVGPTVQAVCAFHVLEHVADPHLVLRLARRHLRPGGLLALEVPNIDSAAARAHGADWSGLQPTYHRWHFGEDALVRLVTDHGFDVLACDTAVFRFYMPAAYRIRHPRYAVEDLRATRSPRLVQRRRGDLLRLVARRREAS